MHSLLAMSLLLLSHVIYQFFPLAKCQLFSYCSFSHLSWATFFNRLIHNSMTTLDTLDMLFTLFWLANLHILIAAN